MHFCSNCDNMLYIRLLEEDSNNLVYYCRNCGESDQVIDKDNICVSKIDVIVKEHAYLYDINEYSKLDPTLPRTNNIKCPDQSCPSNNGEKNEKNEVIYLRYNDKNMQYIYICALCDKIWKTSER